MRKMCESSSLIMLQSTNIMSNVKKFCWSCGVGSGTTWYWAITLKKGEHYFGFQETFICCQIHPSTRKNKVSHFRASDDLRTSQRSYLNSSFPIFLQDFVVHWRYSDRNKLEYWMLLCLMVELLQEDHRLGQTFSIPHSCRHSIIYCWYDLVRFTCLV